MRRRRALLLTATGAGVLLLAGPRVRVRDPGPLGDAATFGVPTDPASLASWLEAREAAVGDIRPGAAKSIVWADPSGPAPTARVVVYLHGFSATRQEVRPLPDSVAAALGANLHYTRLAGHGRPGEAMGTVSAADWMADVAEAFAVAERLGGRVVLMGTSTGASLALWAATRPEWRERLDALVLISPNLGPRDARARMLLWPWGGALLRLVQGRERVWEPANADQALHWTTRYPSRALLPMMALVAHVEDLPLEDVRAPTWMAYSAHDQVIAPEAALAAFERLGSERKTTVLVRDSDDAAQHVLAGDILSPSTTARLTDEIVAFVEGSAPAG